MVCGNALAADHCLPIIRFFAEPARLAAALAVVPALILYAATSRADVAFWDTAEMQTVPWIAGIAHPTGFPLFVIGGWVFSHALPVGTVAWRMSLFSSLAVVGAVWFLFRIIRTETAQPWLGACVALAFATAYTVWSRATRAEVHDFALLFVAATVFYGIRFYRSGAGRDFIAAVGAIGAGIAVHPIAAFALPGTLVLVLARRAKLDRKALAAAGGAALLALATYAYLPIRSAIVTRERLDPTLQLGLAPGSPFWDYGHPADVKGFVWLVSGAQFHTTQGFAGYADPRAVAHAGFAVVTFLRAELGLGACLLALVGIAGIVRRDPMLGSAMILYAAAGVPFAFAYVQEADHARYLLEFEFVAALVAGLGCATLAALAARVVRPSVAWKIAGAAFFFALAGWNVERNRAIVADNRDPLGRNFLTAVVAASPPHSVIVADWTYATALAYGAYVDGTLGKRFVVASRLQDAGPHVLAWSREYCVLLVSDTPRPHFGTTPLPTRSLNASVPYLFAVTSSPCNPR